MENSNYACAVGKIRALENQLLKMADLERLLEADSAETVLRELSDTPYGEHLARIKNINEFEFLLNEELKRTYKLIKEISLHPEITDLFFLEKDLHNLKIILKSKYASTYGENYTVDLGLFSLPVLKETVDKNDYSKFANPLIIQAIKQAIRQYELTGEIELIDFVLDAAFYELAVATARKYKNDFLERLFKLEIDTINLKTLVRFIITKKDKRYFKDVLIHGGDLPYEFFLREIDGDGKEIPQKVHRGRYARLVSYEENLSAKEKCLPFLEECEKIITLGIHEWEKKRTFFYLEKLIDDFLIRYLKRAKYISLGIEPLVAYLFAKEMEVKNIRIIIIGKIGNLPLETIRENLRETYV